MNINLVLEKQTKNQDVIESFSISIISDDSISCSVELIGVFSSLIVIMEVKHHQAKRTVFFCVIGEQFDCAEMH